MKYYLAIFTIILILSIATNCDDKNKKNSNANLEKPITVINTNNKSEVNKKLKIKKNLASKQNPKYIFKNKNLTKKSRNSKKKRNPKKNKRHHS
jgi:hypothetical protein